MTRTVVTQSYGSSIKGVLGKKLGMTQVFDSNNKMIPVTVVSVESCVVTSIRTPEKDGYSAVQLGYGAIDPKKVSIDRGLLLDKIEGEYRRFAFTEDGISPRSRLGLENGVFWNTGDESDEFGHITEDPQVRIKMMDKRMSRLDLVIKRVPQEEQAVSFGIHDFTIISWGSTKGPILDALSMLKKEGIDIGFIQMKLIHPFPAEYVKSLLKDVKTIIDIVNSK